MKLQRLIFWAFVLCLFMIIGSYLEGYQAALLTIPSAAVWSFRLKIYRFLRL